MRTPTIHLKNLHCVELTEQLQTLLNNKTKPLGSLGRLEHLALQIGQILGSTQPELLAPQLVVFAADHGLTAQGISAYPKEVTWQMVENFLAGGAAVSVLAKQHGIALTVVDCGVDHDFLAGQAAGTHRPGLLVRKVPGLERGTHDASVQSAMQPGQCLAAIDNGRALVQALPGNALLLGEMGIGNTSAAALLFARLSGLDIEQCTGAGTGLSDIALQHKIKVLDLGLRLGEGSGAALAWPLLQSACAILCDMASFAAAGVSEKST